MFAFDSQTVSRRQALVTATSLLLAHPRPLFADAVSGPPQGREVAWGTATRAIYDSAKTGKWTMGLRLRTPVTCGNVIATFPIPMDWPEQSVTVVGKSIDPAVAGWIQRDLLGGARQIALRMPRVSAGQSVEVRFEFEIGRSQILAPETTEDLVIPARTPRELRVYMGNSPYIDASHGLIRAASREVDALDAKTDWERVEQIYDFVRDKVTYAEGPIRTASEALRAGAGDCEEMTSLFVALCRNARIPARMVWVPGHCYPEFYLEDGEGNGHWFPCQAAGTRQFGRMQEYRPVLQKGDRFKPPESRAPVRYVSEYFRCDKRGRGDPDPDFFSEPIIGQDVNPLSG